ncbi:hypothetical protein MPTK1_4g23540 [Marchantia polymorpha subsp. ruderalis]|uniref:F-box/LRR-repeat protein 15-like leucin rich repeat domain-containing protein n=2 Tax=Marchantia polymorpha TaxID=3197 RepID=A0AAF6BD06_MARPO|nr:hypothetical protein MARPO_0020s0117 [Marchantia polymorpha]BBN09890.1 hypothetical protein Mp_4g23540 [Marchantia polymorpha subsp. ruderalis]|eukprot:PTQ44467.1 hypothetical protein MARPO_0020s0117 [Marchantia polymorpha]
MAGGGEETSMDKVMRDGGVVALIVEKLRSAHDRYAAALVCRLWHDAVVWQATTLTLRSRDSLPHLVRTFKHIVALDLSCCDEQLTNSELEFCAFSFAHLRSLSVGQADLNQDSISDEGILAFAERCGHLEQIKLANLPKVGDAAMQGLSKGCPLLRCLNLHNCIAMADDSLEAICEFSNLEELQLKGEFKFTAGGLEKIGTHCTGLVKVCFDLGATKIDTALRSLAESCPKLQDLSLKFKHANLRELAKCRSLRSFSVESDQAWDRELNLDESVVAIAKANKNLKEFSFLIKGGLLSDGAVTGIILACPLLETLQLEACNLTDTALMCIVSCKSLQHLVLDGLRSGGHGLTEIGQCGLGLTTFALKNARRVKDVELQTLMDGNRGLETLDLQSCQGPSGIGFSAIALCSNLQYLDLSSTDVDDLSLLAIASGVPNLKQLNLVKCKRINSMETIARFTSLEVLNVDQCSFVENQGLGRVAASCPRLNNLSLAFTRVNDEGLQKLTVCSMLRTLRVSYCRFVLGEGVVAIAKACGGFNHVVLSYRFRDTPTHKALKEQSCRVSLEMDDMALVPFGYNLMM